MIRTTRHADEDLLELLPGNLERGVSVSCAGAPRRGFFYHRFPFVRMPVDLRPVRAGRRQRLRRRSRRPRSLDERRLNPRRAHERLETNRRHGATDGSVDRDEDDRARRRMMHLDDVVRLADRTPPACCC
jgi:hypothetical protein